MNWYYAEQGQQTGPVSDEQLDELLRSGKIQPETLVWREGMAAWATYREAKGGTLPPGASGTVAEGVSESVCAACKPVFLQKLQEGASVNTGEMNYARILTRFGAVFLDGLILGAVNMALGFLVGLTGAAVARNNPGGFVAIQFVMFAIEIGIGMGYETFMIGKYGATLGKMACKIKVVTADGGRVSYGRACGRYFAKMLSGFTCMIGYIIAIFDNPQKRALHDHICNTRVIYK